MGTNATCRPSSRRPSTIRLPGSSPRVGPVTTLVLRSGEQVAHADEEHEPLAGRVEDRVEGEGGEVVLVDAHRLAAGQLGAQRVAVGAQLVEGQLGPARVAVEPHRHPPQAVGEGLVDAADLVAHHRLRGSTRRRRPRSTGRGRRPPPSRPPAARGPPSPRSGTAWPPAPTPPASRSGRARGRGSRRRWPRCGRRARWPAGGRRWRRPPPPPGRRCGPGAGCGGCG